MNTSIWKYDKHWLVTKFMLLLLMQCVVNQSFGQTKNYVPNGSFEAYRYLPCTFTSEKTTFDHSLHDWFMPTEGTPDIYNTTQGENCPMNPLSNHLWSVGSQMPRTGNGMVGMILYEESIGWREYVMVELTEPLTVGKEYYAEFFLSLAEQSRFAVGGIGMLFTEKALSISAVTTIEQIPQIKGDEIITDTLGWGQISGKFVADLPYRFLVIGNFSLNDATAKSLLYGTFAGHSPISYYFLDDVFVTEGCNVDLELVDQVEFCFGDQIRVRPSLVSDLESVFDSTNFKFKWNTGLEEKDIVLTEDGTYKVEAWDGGYCHLKDSLIVLTNHCVPLELPNIITPNNDGVNDFFESEEFLFEPWSLSVFNRNGKIVFRSEHYSNDWNGANLPDGMYYYTAMRRGSVFVRQEQVFKGWVRLCR